MKVIIFAVLSIWISASLKAAPIEFTFNDNFGYSQNEHYFLSHDGTSTVAAYGESSYGTAYTAGWDYGLFICTDTSQRYGCQDNNHQIDGHGPLETLFLDFGASVELISATFSYIGSNDNFSLLADGNLVLDNADLDKGSGKYLISQYNFEPGILGSVFGFGAYYYDDDFKLLGIAVKSVPEPSSLIMMMLGIFSLFYFRKLN